MKSLCLFMSGAVFLIGCSDKPPPQAEPPPLAVLETAISDVGYWRWWTQNTIGEFQVEFGGVLLYNKPTESNAPPSSLLSLRFRDTRCVAALRRHTGLSKTPDDWFDLLAKDKMEPPTITYGEFTLTSVKELRRIIAQAQETRFVIGSESDLKSVKEEDGFLAFWAGDVGLLVVAGEMFPLTTRGQLMPKEILQKSEQWWEYWDEYWKRRGSDNPMPEDYACEVTIPEKKYRYVEQGAPADVKRPRR